MGEMLLEVGGGESVFGPTAPLDEESLDATLTSIQATATSWDAAATVLNRYSDSSEGTARSRADVLVRMRPGSRQPLEVGGSFPRASTPCTVCHASRSETLLRTAFASGCVSSCACAPFKTGFRLCTQRCGSL